MPLLTFPSFPTVTGVPLQADVEIGSESFGRILELRETLMSFQTGFNLVNAAVVCAILESIPGLEPLSVITEPKYLKLVTVSGFCPFTLISVLMPQVLFVNSFVFSAVISMPYAVKALSRRSTNVASSSSPAKPSMLSAKRRLVIVLPPNAGSALVIF